MPNEESEWVHQVARYIHSHASFIQCDNSDRKKTWTDLENVLKLLIIESANLAEVYASNTKYKITSKNLQFLEYFLKHCHSIFQPNI